MIIYKATNIVNGKMYVGQTIGSLKRRKQKHIFGASNNKNNNYFHNAIRKYGPDNFTWEILHECDIIEELNRLEIFYIGYYDTYNNGYNSETGGKNAIPSKETKRKISEALKGRFVSEETKQKMRKNHADVSGENNYWYGMVGKNNPLYGKKLTEDHKMRIGKAHKGKKRKPFSDECRKKMSIAHTGKNNYFAIAVIINDRCFDTLTEAAKFMKVGRATIRNRINHKTKWLCYNYYSAEKPDFMNVWKKK